MRIIIIISLLLLSGCSNVGFGGKELTSAQLDSKIALIDQELNSKEIADFSIKGTYTEVPATTTPDGLTYRVDSIVKWKGFGVEPERGYQIYITKPDGTEKSYGSGILNDSLSYDWKYISTTTATTTK